ncbi:MAG: relaxase/mobilization nuclease domain-containing protein [Flavobacteriaceae bacterium]
MSSDNIKSENIKPENVKLTKTSVTQFYNGNAWSFSSYDDDSITFGKRFISGGFKSSLSNFGQTKANSNSSIGANKQNKIDKISGSKTMIKITGHNNNAAKLKAHVDYITRNGTIDMEDNEGEIHNGDIDNSYSEWVIDHHDRLNNSELKKPRIASSFIISAPPDSDPDVLHDSVREFATKAFSGHRYLMVLHTEETETNTGKITKHPHVHLVIERRSPNNERALETNVKDLMNWRKEFSEIAKSRGLDLSYHRDEISKQPESANNRYVYAMLKKGEIPEELKIKYEIAKKRLFQNRVHTSKGEQKLIDKQVNLFVDRQKEISDLDTLIKTSKSGSLNKKYQNEKRYLEYVNSSQRMPTSTSQLLLKYAIHQRKSQTDPKYKFQATVPTVKHYMYGLKIAVSHEIELPPTANLDTKMLTKFIKEYSDKPTPKFTKYIQDIAQDRELKIKPKILESQNSARNWLKNNINHATIKAMNKAYELSDVFNVNLPKNFDKASISKFIDQYSKQPTEKMNKYAQMISEKTGLAISKDITEDKEKLSKWIGDNQTKEKSKSEQLKILASFSPNERDLEDIIEKSPNIRDEAIIKVIKSGVPFPKEKLNDNEYKLNFLRAHAEFKDSAQWTRLNDKLVSQDKSIEKKENKGKDVDRD